MKLVAIRCVALCVFVLAGCESAPKPKAASAGGTKLTYWEYRDLVGVDVESNPEAQQLRREGWTFLGYSLPYPNENYRVDFPAGYPMVLGIQGHYSSITNSFTTVAHFKRISKVVSVK